MEPPFKPYNKEAMFHQTRRRLPHREQAGCTYFVTWRLADSVPQPLIEQWKAEREAFLVNYPKPWDAGRQREHDERFQRRLERWSDRGYGSCLLRDPQVRVIVAEALHFFDGVRYDLDCYVIMPNHLHLLVRPYGWSGQKSEADIPVCPSSAEPEGRQECLPHSLPGILKSWKGFTARQINQCLQQSGTLWMDENFDHAVRSVAQRNRFREYIRLNPSKARLSPETYSVWQREEHDQPAGET